MNIEARIVVGDPPQAPTEDNASVWASLDEIADAGFITPEDAAIAAASTKLIAEFGATGFVIEMTGFTLETRITPDGDV